MARRIKVASGILNIRLHPHTPARYAEFLEAIYKLRKPVPLRGDRYGMISLLNRAEAGSGVLMGVITTFLNIDFDGEWFNTSDLKEATDEQISEVSIPENLHPNAASFFFEFHTGSHKLYFETYSRGKALSPNQARALFSGLADDLKITGQFGSAKITVVQSKDGLDALFKLPVIKEIKITIYKPNADIFADDFEEQIEAHLEQAHSQRVTLSYEAEPGDSLVPTDEIKAVSAVALENGVVAVRGRSLQGAVTRSTDDLPEVLQGKYDPDEVSEQEAFRRLLPRQQNAG
jgi:Domain of unknown function (DUF4747)